MVNGLTLQSALLGVVIATGFYFLALNVSYLLLLLFSTVMIRRRDAEAPALELAYRALRERRDAPLVTVLVPAWNEELVIIDSLRSLQRSQYPNVEIVVINDGSTDGTLRKLDAELELEALSRSLYRSRKMPRIRVIDQQNAGKAAALNAGLAVAGGAYICTIDADTVVEPDAFLRSVTRFLERPASVKAIGGTVRVVNGSRLGAHRVVRGHLPTRPLALFQVIEYIRAFFCGRMGWELVSGTPLLPGAYTVYSREALEAVGGFDPQSICEDFEMLLRLKRHYSLRNEPCELRMLPEPVCWTLAPENLGDLYRQRLRWQRGLIQGLLKHRSLVLDPRLGLFGLVTLPYMVIFEALGPIVELAGFGAVCAALALGLLDPYRLALFIAIGVGFGLLVTLASIRNEELHYARHDPRKGRARFVLGALLENLGYRQLILLWRFEGTVSAFMRKVSWGAHHRKELGKS